MALRGRATMLQVLFVASRCNSSCSVTFHNSLFVLRRVWPKLGGSDSSTGRFFLVGVGKTANVIKDTDSWPRNGAEFIGDLTCDDLVFFCASTPSSPLDSDCLWGFFLTLVRSAHSFNWQLRVLWLDLLGTHLVCLLHLLPRVVLLFCSIWTRRRDSFQFSVFLA